eukprot:IDg17304t1
MCVRVCPVQQMWEEPPLAGCSCSHWRFFTRGFEISISTVASSDARAAHAHPLEYWRVNVSFARVDCIICRVSRRIRISCDCVLLVLMPFTTASRQAGERCRVRERECVCETQPSLSSHEKETRK